MIKKWGLLKIGAVIMAAFFLLFSSTPTVQAGFFDSVNQVHREGLVSAALQENAGLSFALVAIVGLLDGVNPCSVHLILILAGYMLLFVKDRKRAIQIGFTFILTIFVTYFIFGAALSAFVGQMFDNSAYWAIGRYVNMVLAAVLAVSGFINMKDAIFFRRNTLDIQKWQSSYIVKKLSNLHFPGTVLVAFISTLFLLPCSLPIYLGSINILSATFSLATTLFYILVYCLMFVVPLYVVMSVMLRAQQYINVEDFEPQNYRKLRFFESLVQLVIVVILLFF